MRAANLLESAARWAPPLLVPVVILTAWQAGPDAYARWVSAPDSILEDALGVVLVVALITSIHAVSRPETSRYRRLRPWLVVWCLGLFYFLGEDLNWGQYIFGWQPPEFFAEHNKEAETNLHNMSTWFNQKPRLAVQLWILVAGFLVPLGWRWPRQATAKFVPAVLWPGRKTMWLALLAAILPAFEWIAIVIFGPSLGGVPVRFSEIQEFFFAWFFLLYAIDLTGRLRTAEAGAAVEAKAARSHAE